jgi:hypothetical protein
LKEGSKTADDKIVHCISFEGADEAAKTPKNIVDASQDAPRLSQSLPRVD